MWAVVTGTGKYLLIFVDEGVKINQGNYKNSVFEQSLLPSLKEHLITRS